VSGILKGKITSIDVLLEFIPFLVLAGYEPFLATRDCLYEAIRFVNGQKEYDLFTALASFDGVEFEVNQYRKAAEYLGFSEDNVIRIMTASDDVFVGSYEAPLRKQILEKTSLLESEEEKTLN
jgi:hypothetical protein